MYCCTLCRPSAYKERRLIVQRQRKCACGEFLGVRTKGLYCSACSERRRERARAIKRGWNIQPLTGTLVRCRWCDKQFATARVAGINRRSGKALVFCSENCRQAATYEGRYSRVSFFDCAQCGTFVIGRGANTKFCSKKCLSRHRSRCPSYLDINNACVDCNKAIFRNRLRCTKCCNKLSHKIWNLVHLKAYRKTEAYRARKRRYLKKWVSEARDTYVKDLLRHSMKGVKKSQIPEQLVQAYRAHLMVRRELRKRGYHENFR